MEKSPENKLPHNVHQGLPEFAKKHGLATKIVETEKGWAILGSQNKGKELSPDNAEIFAQGTTQWEAFQNFMEVFHQRAGK